MRHYILSALFVLFSLLLCGQAGFIYSVSVVNRSGNPARDVKVWLYDKQQDLKIEKRTNSEGDVRFVVPPGEWSVNLLGMPNYKEFDVEEGVKGKGSMLVSYDYVAVKRERDFINKRPFVEFEEINQSKLQVNAPRRGYCVVHVDFKDEQSKPLNNIEVRLLSVKHKKAFLNKSNKNGRASFLVPLGGIYSVDVEEVKNYSFTGNLFREGIITMTLDYEPTKIKETELSDTIMQTITPAVKATTARSLVDLHIRMAEGETASYENVYLTQVSTGKVYKAKTDENGSVTFLLPNGDRYLLHFEYEKDIDVLNLTKVRNRNTINAKFIYNPDPRMQYPERYIPTPDKLFLQSFESFIENELPKPKDKPVSLFLKWGNAFVNGNSTSAVLELGISVTDEPQDNSDAAPIDVAFVVDRSGSMAGYERIESLKESMTEFVDKMRSGDRVSIVSFESEASLDMALERKGTGQKAKQRIAELDAGGGTDIYNGLEMGYQLLKENKNGDRRSHLLLLTDGYGSREPAEVVKMSDSYVSQGIGLSAIGVGYSYNSALLTLLTMKTGRLIEHVGDADGLSDAFNRQLSHLLYPIGEDASLKITYNNKIVFKSIFGLQPTGRSDSDALFDVGDLYWGMNKVALAKFELNRPDNQIEKQPVTVELTYFDKSRKKNIRLVEKAYLIWDPSYNNAELVLDAEMKKLYAIAIMNQSMKVMAEAFVLKDYEKAKQAIESSYKQVKELFPDANDADVDKLVSQLANYINGLTLCLQKEEKQR